MKIFGNISSRLKAKLGPLPIWGWVSIAGGALWYFLHKRPSDDKAASDTSGGPAYVDDYGGNANSAGGAAEDVSAEGAAPAYDESGRYFPDAKLGRAQAQFRDDVMHYVDALRDDQEFIGNLGLEGKDDKDEPGAETVDPSTTKRHALPGFTRGKSDPLHPRPQGGGLVVNKSRPMPRKVVTRFRKLGKAAVKRKGPLRLPATHGKGFGGTHKVSATPAPAPQAARPRTSVPFTPHTRAR